MIDAVPAERTYAKTAPRHATLLASLCYLWQERRCDRLRSDTPTRTHAPRDLTFASFAGLPQRAVERVG